MNLSRALVCVLVGSTCLLTSVSVAQDKGDSDSVLSQLRALTEEVRELKTKVAELERRLKSVESNQMSLRFSPFENSGSLFDKQTHFHFELLQHPRAMGDPESLRDFYWELPDTGLYVFPGIDAPPLSPMDALLDRLQNR